MLLLFVSLLLAMVGAVGVARGGIELFVVLVPVSTLVVVVVMVAVVVVVAGFVRPAALLL